MLIIGGYPVQVLGQVGQLEVVNKEVLELLALICSMLAVITLLRL